MKEKIGFAGKLAHAFIDSKLTPLIIVASILLGIGAVLMLPREEEPGPCETGTGAGRHHQRPGLCWLWPDSLPYGWDRYIQAG